MTISINEQDIAIAKYLNEINVKYNVIYIADRANDEEWPCDEWAILFNNETFSFKTGLGLRINRDKTSKYNYMKFNPSTGRRLKELREIICAKSAYHTINSNSLYAIKPTQAGVLHCLLSDSIAADESFNNWCDNFEYDSDSMKAFSIYQTCTESAKKLNNVFNREQLNKLNELLEDY